jgi:molecular chaperone GrpE
MKQEEKKTKNIKESEVKITKEQEQEEENAKKPETACDPKDKETEYLLGWRRCLADFENYKKRQQENQKNLDSYIKEDLILQIIPVIDNFRNATEHIPNEQKEIAWVVGIMYIQKQLENILKENGVIEIAVKTGDEFDPNFHEAIADKETEKQESGVGKIKKVILQGYQLGEKIIRPARVIVE